MNDRQPEPAPPGSRPSPTYLAVAGLALLGEVLIAVIWRAGADFNELLLPAAAWMPFSIWLLFAPRQSRASGRLAQVMLGIALGYPGLVFLGFITSSGWEVLMLLDFVLWALAAAEGMLFLVWLGLYVRDLRRRGQLSPRHCVLLAVTAGVPLLFAVAILVWGLGA